MNSEEEFLELQHKREQEPTGEAWYAGLNSTLDEDSRALCAILMSHLGVGPRSKGVEYILTALESQGDSALKARCLAEVMQHLANDPSDYYLRMIAKKTDFTSSHGFNHHARDFYEALGIDERGQVEVMKLMVEMSKGILQTIFNSRSLSARRIGLVFERTLNTYSDMDKKIVATAIYNLLTAPIIRPVQFMQTAESQSIL